MFLRYYKNSKVFLVFSTIQLYPNCERVNESRNYDSIIFYLPEIKHYNSKLINIEIMFVCNIQNLLITQTKHLYSMI